jgi:glutamine amidotransferase
MSSDKPKITVVDYGTGNRGSIVNMLRRIGVACDVTDTPSGVAAATSLIIPGVGAFDAGMKNLESRGLVGPIREAALERGVPTLGICLGMQLLADGSEEGVLPGLSLIPGRARRFVQPADGPPIKIPHMGWANLEIARANRFLSEGEQRFYFVHSYHVVCDVAEDVIAFANHGGRCVAAFERRNILGVQFHPEKSHRFGMELLKTFAEQTCAPA